MKTFLLTTFTALFLLPAFSEEKAADTPILELKAGDWIQYDVNVKIPEGIQAKNSQAVDANFKRTRTFIGKVKPSDKYPETSCFEVTAPGAPVEREFVDIDNERVLMRGSLTMATGKLEPLWLEPAVLLVRAGLKGGETLPPIEIKDPRSGALVRRNIQIVAREEIDIMGKKFPAIRILMTGTDGSLQLRRTIWFTPGKGILKEEKARYIDDNLVLKETQIATSTGDKNNSPVK